MYHTIARLLDVERCIAGGAFEHVDRALDALLDETRDRNALVHAWCSDTLERLRAVRASRADIAIDFDLDASPLGSVARGVIAQRRVLRRARFGLAHASDTSVDVEGSILREMIAATDAILAGAKNEALASAARAVETATKHAWGGRECEARVLLYMRSRGRLRRFAPPRAG